MKKFNEMYKETMVGLKEEEDETSAEMKDTIAKLEKKGFRITHVSHQGWVMLRKKIGSLTYQAQVDEQGLVNDENVDDYLNTYKQ